MDMIVGFVRRVTEIWLDSGVVIPAILTGIYFSSRYFGNFFGIAAVVAVIDHILVVMLYKFKSSSGISIIDALVSNVAERIVAFLVAAVVTYIIASIIRKAAK